MAELMFERVFTPIGIAKSDLSWRGNAYRPGKIGDIPRREFGSGISANVDAMARFGLMYLRNGHWQDKQIIPAEFVKQARTTPATVKGLPVAGDQKYAGASNHYGLAVLRNTLSDTLTWAIERFASDGWSCDRIKAHLELT